ncbi:MAG: glycosyl transferase family 1 [Dehalococcoidia bacterium]|nr:glycosyl transferase family 1 [Dehalococcoidia bacterium]
MIIGINAQKLYRSQDYHNAGISRYIGQLLTHLRPKTRHDFVVFANEQLRHWDGLNEEHMELLASTWPTSRPAVRMLWEQLVLPWAAWRHRLDVLHCPLNVLPLAATVPCVVTVHDLSFERFPGRFHPVKQRYLAAFTRLSARRAGHILTDSASTRDDITRFYGVPTERMSVVYPGVDADFAPIRDAHVLEEFRRRYGLEGPYILYLGTLEPRKNVDRLVRSFAALVAEGGPRFRHRLVLVGGKGWDYQAIFRAIEEEGIADRVLAPGYVPRAEQPLWYNAADLFVYPSEFEGFGFPVLEAMACGVPVITTRASSLPEVVGDAGHLVPPSDEAALTAAMADLLSRPEEVEALGAAGIIQAAHFTWERAAAACLAVYERLGSGTQQPCLAP